MTRARMLDLTRQLGKEAAPRIDEALAREVGRKAGVRALLVASIRKLGEIYTAELQAIDPEKDEYLFTFREQARTKDELLPLIDRLSDRVRLGLREEARDVAVADIKVAQAITPSLEAYRHYFRGKEALARLDSGRAQTAFLEAVKLEPRFALAQFEIAYLGFQYAAREKHVIRDAVRNGAHAPAKEAGLIRALDAFLGSRFDEALREVQALLARYPEDPDVAYLATGILSFCGDYAADLRLVEGILRARPDDHTIRLEQITALQVLGRPQAGLALALEVAGRERSPVTAILVGVARAVAGDLAGANADLATAGGDPISDWVRSQALAASGRFAEALQPLQGVDHYFYGLSKAVALSYAGRRREAAAALERAASHPDADADQMRTMRSITLAAAGDPEGSRRAWPGRDMAPTLDMPRHFEAGDDAKLVAIQGSFVPGGVGGQVAGALLAWRQGRRGEALAVLRALDRPAGWLVPYYRGALAAEAGHHEEAVEALRRFEKPMLFWGDALFHPWLQARARLHLARSLDALGRREEGRRYVELQLSRWRQADQDLPLLAEARAVCRKLECRVP